MKPDETFEVIGESTVFVYDASRALIKILPSQEIRCSNMIKHILAIGDSFHLKKKKVIRK